MTLRAYDRSLPMQLMRAREAVMQRFRPLLRAHGLSEQQWRVIRVLAEVEASEMLDLAGRCLIHPPSLSRMIPRLEAMGLVARRVAAQDQRRVAVALTPDGRALFARIAPESEAIYAEIAATLGVEGLERTYAVLDGLIAGLSA